MAIQEKVIAKAVPVQIREDGSVPIPKELLELVQWQPNDEVLVFEEDGHLVIMTRQQLADEIVKLLQVLKDADWDWLEREREDDPQRL
ncbi:MAG: AbrB/MazE/SpoVT family DNA-binding domain-containing protein [Armatimonadetes bacterium]|nr:AbrB/MazE/SpoVT family DNA-binding domain-containing protein [Armatimonadota bacterium]